MGSKEASIDRETRMNRRTNKEVDVVGEGGEKEDEGEKGVKTATNRQGEAICGQYVPLPHITSCSSFYFLIDIY